MMVPKNMSISFNTFFLLSRKSSELSNLGLSEENLGWSCPFMLTTWSHFREVHQAALFHLLNVNE